MSSQLLRFSGVGAAATLTHMLVALVVEGMFHFPAQIANFTGFCAAVGLSYFGHAFFTFNVERNHAIYLPRFILLALAGLTTSSAITYVVYTKLNASFTITMALVAITVPVMTFLGSKFWAFSETQKSTALRWTVRGVILIIAAAFIAQLWNYLY